MIYVIIFFFLVSVFLYNLLGGADFGAGVIEAFSKSNKERTRTLINKAMAPIWEANHMWLIIAVVIMFNAFPPIYRQVSISLYIPLIILLLGIVLRGTAFTFRHYDAYKDKSQEIYSKVFAYSSILTTFFFGVITAAIITDRITVNPTTFHDAYIRPWFNLFTFATGVFETSICAFVASVYLIGDASDQEDRNAFIKKSRIASLVMVFAGAVVFGASYIEGIDFADRFLSNPYSIGLIVLSSLTLPVLWNSLSEGRIWRSRILAGAILLFIISAYYIIYFPAVILIRDAEDLTLFNSAAPEVTLKYLGYALLVGSLLIFPSLIYLIKVFKLEKVKEEL